jgi:Bifunctional DNA primase/polymerase, N-terminal
MNNTTDTRNYKTNESRPLRGVQVRPLRKGAQAYHERGWPVVPTSRRGTKRPLVAGLTGHDGIDADTAQLAELIARYPWANLGLRLPFDVLGLDVDAYDGRAGAATLRRLCGQLGPLSTTWRSTSRAPEDPVSGIYLFHAPREPDWKWVGDLGTGSGIEIIQRHHRFVSAWPSVHNTTKRSYCWWRGDRRADIPRPTDLPLLPVSWARYLLSRHRYKDERQAAPRELAEWYGRVSGGEMCAGMDRSAHGEARKVRDAARSSNLHDTLIAAVTHLCRNAAEGCTGLDRALNAVEAEVMQAERDRDLRTEWEGAVKSAMAKAAALEQEIIDPCSLRSMRPTRRSHAR